MHSRRRSARGGRRLTGLLAAAVLAGAAAPAAAHTPHDIVNQLAISPDFATDGTLFAVFALSEHHVFARSFDGGRSWDQRGMEMVAHGVTALVFSPDFSDDGTAFAATDGGGVYRTTDVGDTWTAINHGLASLHVNDVAVSRGFAADRTVAVATADGCFVSRDGGVSWRAHDVGLVESDLRRVAFLPSPDPARALLVAGRVLHRSMDGGRSWTPLDVFDAPVSGLAVSPSYRLDRTLAVAVTDDGGVLVSTDGGLRFAPSMQGLGDSAVNDVVFAEDGSLFAVSKLMGCWRSDGPFAPWSLLVVGLDPPAPQTSSHYRAVRPSPDFARDGIVFLGAFEGLYRSDDRGDTWRQRDIFHQRINRSFLVSPGFADDRMILLGNFGGGLFVTRDGGESWEASPPPGAADCASLAWESRGNGLTNLYTGPLAVSPLFAADDTLFYGHVGLFRSRNRGQAWTKIPLPPPLNVVRGIVLSPTFDIDQTAFFGTGTLGVWRSMDGGDTWQDVSTGIPPLFRTRELVFSPDWEQDRTIFVSGRQNGVWRSTDGGSSWVDANTGLTHRSTRVIEISPDYATDGTVLVGTVGGGLFISRDRGQTWSPSNLGITDSHGIDVEGIAISPDFARDRTVFVSAQRSGVWKSTDGGHRWHAASAGLGPAMPRTIEVSPAFATDRTVFLSTHDWLWCSEDAGGSWQRLPGFVRVPDDHPQVIYSAGWKAMDAAGNHGRGLRSATEPGPWFEYEFFGDSITWFARRDLTSGLAEIRLDGQLEATVDLFHFGLQNQQAVWSMTFPEPGWHTLRITAAGASPVLGFTDDVHSDGLAFTF